jgi:biopolymer transport protein ExbD
VILRTDAKCEYQRVVQARNALRLVGVELILEEVEPRNGNP